VLYKNNLQNCVKNFVLLKFRQHAISKLSVITRVQSDKDRTGTITIVPVRTGTVFLEKYWKF